MTVQNLSSRSAQGVALLLSNLRHRSGDDLAASAFYRGHRREIIEDDPDLAVRLALGREGGHRAYATRNEKATHAMRQCRGW